MSRPHENPPIGDQPVQTEAAGSLRAETPKTFFEQGPQTADTLKELLLTPDARFDLTPPERRTLRRGHPEQQQTPT
jgi:hypothetical protein